MTNRLVPSTSVLTRRNDVLEILILLDSSFLGSTRAGFFAFSSLCSPSPWCSPPFFLPSSLPWGGRPSWIRPSLDTPSSAKIFLQL